MTLLHLAKPDADLPPKLDRISDYLTRGAQAFPDRPALITGETETTYAEANANVDAIAKALIAAGVQKGARVATLLPPCSLFFEIFLAAASIGAIWLGLNPKHTRREMAHPLRDATPSLIIARSMIADRDVASELRAVVGADASPAHLVAAPDPPSADDFQSWDAFLKAGDAVTDEALQAARAEVAAADPCLIVYTSGTTGAPKGAVLTHQGLTYCSQTDAKYNTASNGQRMLCNFPINHIACVGDVCCTTLVVGGTIVFMEEFDPRGVLETVERRKLTHLGQIPAMFQMVLAHPDFEAFDLSSLKQILWGGNPASVDLVRRLRAICPNLANVYGMTETTGNVIFARGAPITDEQFANSIGWAPLEYEVAILDEAGAPAAQGEIGEIHVRGPFVMQGYWRNPEATAQAFTDDGWLRTGDLAARRADGMIALAGRRSQMFKSGGYNVYPAEVEQAIESHPGVALAAVVAVPDPLYHEVGHAFVVPAGEDLTEDALRSHCRDVLANYKIPKTFALIDDVPMLPNGKIDTRVLADRARGS
ncbi:MAG: AMP-binding protein [Maricaulaceae bacterium]